MSNMWSASTTANMSLQLDSLSPKSEYSILLYDPRELPISRAVSKT